MSFSGWRLGTLRSRLPWPLSRLFGSSVLTVCLLSTAVLNCPPPDPKKSKRINVPFVAQERDGWCSAACVQMWAKYLYPEFQTAQVTVASWTGYFGADSQSTVRALSHFINVTAEEFSYPKPGDGEPLNYWQDILMSGQGDNLNNNRPSIPIVYGTRQTKHAVIWTGWVWENTDQGPLIHDVFYNDPAISKDYSPLTVAEYKTSIFEPFWFEGHQVYSVVMQRGGSLISRAQDELNTFVSRRGRFSGGPRYYDPRDFNIFPRPAK